MYINYLWANSRMKWVKKPGKKTRGCTFCGIAKGNPNIPKKVLYKDRDLMVIMNIFPYNVGHLQVVPVRHVVWLEDLTREEFDKLFKMVKKTILLLRKTLNPSGFNVGLNFGGGVSGGSILHLHVQIVPRYERDLGFMELTAETKVMPESLDRTYRKLMKNVKILGG